MARKLTETKQKRVKEAIYIKADNFGYMTAGRIESGKFMDDLVDDPEVGGILKDYMTKERVRTYIKDGVLNAYTKQKNRHVLASKTPEDTVRNLFAVEAQIIQECKAKNKGLFVLRASNGDIFVVSSGTTLKWETALKKALELIAREPGLTINANKPRICLRLSELSQLLTDADRDHIRTALGAIGVKAIFCSNE